MDYLFYNNVDFNQDISNWDVSRVRRHSDFAFSSLINETNKMSNFKD